MIRRDHRGVALRRDRESGQAMVEFALILFPLLTLVVGIIWFGIGLNYWLDLQRIANQGARWAAVNAYPGCPRTGPNSPCSPTLQEYIACQPVPGALNPTVTISFPAGTSKLGDPVKVEVSTPFKLVPFLNAGTVSLQADATMRMESAAGRYGAGSAACP